MIGHPSSPEEGLSPTKDLRSSRTAGIFRGRQTADPSTPVRKGGALPLRMTIRRVVWVGGFGSDSDKIAARRRAWPLGYRFFALLAGLFAGVAVFFAGASTFFAEVLPVPFEEAFTAFFAGLGSSTTSSAARRSSAFVTT